MNQHTFRLRQFKFLLAVCIVLPFFGSVHVVAKNRKHPGKKEETPAHGSEWVPPGDWPAGARVNAFLQTYLEQNILAPLDAPAGPPRGALSSLDLDFAAHLLAAQSPTERALYSNATGLCNLLARVLDEREREQISLVDVSTGGHAVNPLDMPTSAVSGHYSWNLEEERARGERRQAIQARLNALDKKNFFISSSLRQWSNLTAGYRQSIQNAAINVSAAQIRYDREQAEAATHPATPTASTPAPVVTGPPTPATAPRAPTPGGSPAPTAAANP